MPVTGQRFRHRKLSTKANIGIYRENEVDALLLLDADASSSIPRIETGVEKAEEIEHHLQAVISAAQAGGDATKAYIPTPETVESSLKYEDLYPRHYQQPQTYIRFSSTVEDCVGCPYCMDSEDDVFLKEMNNRRAKMNAPQCTEDEFEVVMNFFEETTASKQPFAAVDNSSAMSYEEMEGAFDETIDEGARKFAQDIYAHWKDKRLKKENRLLMPTLKFETNMETDDSDPYVCFRRREVRQTRKTRGRDAQVTEKLKKMRRELEDARVLLKLVRDREAKRREILAIDRTIFDARTSVKEAKRNLGIKGDDEDLINQKPVQKPKPKLDAAMVQRGIPGLGPKAQAMRPANLPESDLIMLQDLKDRKEEEILHYVEENITKHLNWNKGMVDYTWRPLTPPLERNSRSSFREASTAMLPTPPPSVTSDQSGDNVDANVKSRRSSHTYSNTDLPTIRYASPPSDEPTAAFRRRLGRNNRTWIDRKGIKRPWDEFEEDNIKDNFEAHRLNDRWKFDQDSDSEDDIRPADPHNDAHMRYRILLKAQQSQQYRDSAQARRMLAEQAHHQVSPSHNRSSSGHLLPPSR